MKLTEELLAAFRATHYHVELQGRRVLLQVDAPCEALRQWMRDGAHACAAVLTAHNPRATRRDATANLAAQQRLHAVLRERGLAFHEGCNEDPRDHWPAEDSVLVADLTLTQARQLAADFGQAAFLWCDDSAVPRLHLTVPD